MGVHPCTQRDDRKSMGMRRQDVRGSITQHAHCCTRMRSSTHELDCAAKNIRTIFIPIAPSTYAEIVQQPGSFQLQLSDLLEVPRSDPENCAPRPQVCEHLVHRRQGGCAQLRLALCHEAPHCLLYVEQSRSPLGFVDTRKRQSISQNSYVGIAVRRYSFQRHLASGNGSQGIADCKI